MTSTPVVSILMPVYNGKKYLAEAINSILEQSYTDFELLVLDDGSTDGSLELVRNIKDKRIRLIADGQNLQQPKRYNQGVQLARGKYIAIMHADDIALPERLRKQVNFLDSQPEYDIVGTKVCFFNEAGRYTRSTGVAKQGEYLQLYCLFNCPFFHPTLLFRKQVLEEHPYREDFTTAEDYELWSRILRWHKGANLNEILLHYRIHSSNNSRRKNKQQLENIKQIWRQLFAYWQLPIDEAELDIHLLCSQSYHAPLSIVQLASVERWLLHIRKIVLEKNTWKAAWINQLLYSTWLAVCKKSSKHGWRVMAIFWGSSISKMGFDMQEIGILTLKCVLKYQAKTH